MIEFVKNSIFESDCDTAWVNPVNCVGVMGAGLAKEFKLRFPDVYKRYKYDCSKHLLRLGKVYPYEIERGISQFSHTPLIPRVVLCATTKYHWSDFSSIDIVERVLDDLLAWGRKQSFMCRIAVPYIGCGLGGVNFKLVKKLFIEKFEKENCMYKIYEYKME
jgi:O-acetyl-ADP-ribose deacetylase (regulator of RNase III)